MNKGRKVIGTFFKDAREKAGLTQAQVADKFGYTSPQFISNIERGRCATPMKLIARLTDMYQVKPEAVVNLMTRVYKEHVKRELT